MKKLFLILVLILLISCEKSNPTQSLKPPPIPIKALTGEWHILVFDDSNYSKYVDEKLRYFMISPNSDSINYEDSYLNDGYKNPFKGYAKMDLTYNDSVYTFKILWTNPNDHSDPYTFEIYFIDETHIKGVKYIFNHPTTKEWFTGYKTNFVFP